MNSMGHIHEDKIKELEEKVTALKGTLEAEREAAASLAEQLNSSQRQQHHHQNQQQQQQHSTSTIGNVDDDDVHNDLTTTTTTDVEVPLPPIIRQPSRSTDELTAAQAHIDTLLQRIAGVYNLSVDVNS